jgi:methanogenic corrinoid protein MtbC1
MRSSARNRHVPAHDALPLRTVAARTGLTPDLIRAWEKRYAVVAPIRGARGARLYSSADVAHLRLLGRVVGAGRAIGDVAALSQTALERLIAQGALNGRSPESSDATAPREEVVTCVMDRLAAFDEAAVTRLLGDAVVGLGTRSFVHTVVVPLVHQIGARWAARERTIGEEHLLTGALRNLLGGLLHARTATGNPMVLATPAGERHEIGLLSVALLAKDAGVKVVYLGVDLPSEEILRVAERTHARVVGLSIVGAKNRTRATQEVSAVRDALPHECELWLGGVDAAAVASDIPNFAGMVLATLSATEAELERVAAGTTG